ncbi:MAG: tape measure protein, partial [Chryseotalea sp.]
FKKMQVFGDISGGSSERLGRNITAYSQLKGKGKLSAEEAQQFEENLVKNGIIVHWADTAEEHNEIVYSILKSKEIPFYFPLKTASSLASLPISIGCATQPLVWPQGIRTTSSTKISF